MTSTSDLGESCGLCGKDCSQFREKHWNKRVRDWTVRMSCLKSFDEVDDILMECVNKGYLIDYILWRYPVRRSELGISYKILARSDRDDSWDQIKWDFRNKGYGYVPVTVTENEYEVPASGESLPFTSLAACTNTMGVALEHWARRLLNPGETGILIKDLKPKFAGNRLLYTDLMEELEESGGEAGKEAARVVEMVKAGAVSPDVFEKADKDGSFS